MMSVESPEGRRSTRRYPPLGRVLAVDDDPAVLARVHDSLECWGYVVESVASAVDALRRIESEAFDVVITDLRMPEMSGEELIRQLRRSLAHRHVPIIVLFGETDRVQFDLLRVEMSISKPFRPRALLGAVGTLIALHRRSQTPELGATERGRPLVAVVRRDRAEVFSALDHQRAELNIVRVVWDRRLSQRRGAGPRWRGERPGSERRAGDRRATPSASWNMRGYVLVARVTDGPTPMDVDGRPRG